MIFHYLEWLWFYVTSKVKRDNNLKIPKQVIYEEEHGNTVEDFVAIKKAYATANDKKFNEKKELEKAEKIDREMEKNYENSI